MKKQTLFIVTYNVSVRGSWLLHLFKQTEYYLDDMNRPFVKEGACPGMAVSSCFIKM